MSFDQVVEIARQQDEQALENFFKEHDFEGTIQGDLTRSQVSILSLALTDEGKLGLSKQDMLNATKLVDDSMLSPVTYLLLNKEREAAAFLVRRGCPVKDTLRFLARRGHISDITFILSFHSKEYVKEFGPYVVAGCLESPKNSIKTLQRVLRNHSDFRADAVMQLAGTKSYDEISSIIGLKSRRTKSGKKSRRTNFRFVKIYALYYIKDSQDASGKKFEVFSDLFQKKMKFPKSWGEERIVEFQEKFISHALQVAIRTGDHDLAQMILKGPYEECEPETLTRDYGYLKFRLNQLFRAPASNATLNEANLYKDVFPALHERLKPIAEKCALGIYSQRSLKSFLVRDIALYAVAAVAFSLLAGFQIVALSTALFPMIASVVLIGLNVGYRFYAKWQFAKGVSAFRNLVNESDETFQSLIELDLELDVVESGQTISKAEVNETETVVSVKSEPGADKPRASSLEEDATISSDASKHSTGAAKSGLFGPRKLKIPPRTAPAAEIIIEPSSAVVK